MAWLLWARFLVLALLVGLLVAFMWIERPQEGR
jgi:hypothetical protein